MRQLSTFSFILLGCLMTFCLARDVASQKKNETSGSITVIRCLGCEYDALEFPRVQYPGYVGTGPHKYNGEVGVQVTIDQNGNVTGAKGISGHPFFRPMLEKVSFSVKFRPQQDEVKLERKGVLIFLIRSGVQPTKTTVKTISCSLCADQAIFLPKPSYALHFVSGSVTVEVLIDEFGNVESTKAVSGHPLLRAPSVAAARKARFPVTYVSGKPVKVRTSIVYEFKR